MSASWPVASHIALEPNVGFPGIAEVAGAFQDRETLRVRAGQDGPGITRAPSRSVAGNASAVLRSF